MKEVMKARMLARIAELGASTDELDIDSLVKDAEWDIRGSTQSFTEYFKETIYLNNAGELCIDFMDTVESFVNHNRAVFRSMG